MCKNATAPALLLLEVFYFAHSKILKEGASASKAPPKSTPASMHKNYSIDY